MVEAPVLGTGQCGFESLLDYVIRYETYVVCDCCGVEMNYGDVDAREAMRLIEKQYGWKVQRLVTDLTMGQAKCPFCFDCDHTPFV